jgi:glycosyltransferase involved in cell wall biosynthesis
MAAGRVVLAAHHTPAKRATVQAFAAACPPLLLADSAAALAEEVPALVASPARERFLIAEGLELTRRHTWERVCAEYLGLWRRAAP